MEGIRKVTRVVTRKGVFLLEVIRINIKERDGIPCSLRVVKGGLGDQRGSTKKITERTKRVEDL